MASYSPSFGCRLAGEGFFSVSSSPSFGVALGSVEKFQLSLVVADGHREKLDLAEANAARRARQK